MQEIWAQFPSVQQEKSYRLVVNVKCIAHILNEDNVLLSKE
jgi:hypothetical protein